MGDADNDYYEVEINLWNLFKFRFRIKRKPLRIKKLDDNDDSAVFLVQTDKGEVMYVVVRKTETGLKIVIINVTTGEILGMFEV